MIIVSKDWIKGYYICMLRDVNESIFNTGEPGPYSEFCIALGGALSEEERKECEDEVRDLLKKKNIILEDHHLKETT